MDELDDSVDPVLAALRSHRFRRRMLWMLIAVVVIATLILTPPLINANRLRLRIANKMSESLGRPVHLDKVTLNILPVPGFTLENLVVGEDPSFGNEPVIRADSVHATIRASSLWRHQVEFGTISFEAPSVNLVRRADGRWNFESILLHAEAANTAPTAQTGAGPAPRFPYIEATGARLNVKIDDEKKPFALTESDFALWQPSPQEWRFRIDAKPARTDTNVSDTGIVTVEATLQRAARVADVPIELTAAWRRAPLGEASRVLTGVDAGWRGNLEATSALNGTLGDATLTTTLKLTNLRRADFIPAKMLNVEVECNGHVVVSVALLHEPSCTLALNKKDPTAGLLAATADTLDLPHLRSTNLRLGATNVPDAWLLDWARLLSQRIPATFEPKGKVAGSIDHAPDSGWQGEFHDTVELVDRTAPAAKPSTETRVFSVAVGNDPSETLAVHLAPVNIAPPGNPPLMLTGTATHQMYSLDLDGLTTSAQLHSLIALLPPLGDNLAPLLPATTKASDTIKVDLTCQRRWGAQPVCTTKHQPETAKPHTRHRH
jgi:AsmA protein